MKPLKFLHIILLYIAEELKRKAAKFSCLMNDHKSHREIIGVHSTLVNQRDRDLVVTEYHCQNCNLNFFKQEIYADVKFNNAKPFKS